MNAHGSGPFEQLVFADDFRRNRASQLRGVGRRADPDVMAAAQAEIDATKGTGVPSLANEAEANGMSIPQYLRSGASSYGDGEEAERVAAAFEARQARREAEKNRRTANGVRSVIEDNAKRIATTKCGETVEWGKGEKLPPTLTAWGSQVTCEGCQWW